MGGIHIEAPCTAYMVMLWVPASVLFMDKHMVAV